MPPVLGPLVVLHRRHRGDRDAVGERLQGELLALGLLLDDHAGLAAHFLFEHLGGILEDVVLVQQLVACYLHALAAGEPDGLDRDALVIF
jgi:hypothetical protein